MRVLFALHGFPPECVGGTERVAEALGRELGVLGHEVHVVCGSLRTGSPRAVERAEHEGMEVTRIFRNDLYFDDWDKGWHPGVSEAFAAELSRVRPDIVHVHHWIRLSRDLVRRAAARSTPAVVSLHDFHASCPRTFRVTDKGAFCDVPLPEAPCLGCAPRRSFQGDREVAMALDLYRRDFQEELRAASLVTAPSRAHAAAVARYLAFPLPEVEVVPSPALRVLAPRRAPPAAGGSGAGVLRVLHWGNLYDLKGTHVLLRALRRARHRDRMRVELWGEAPFPDYEERLRREAEGLPVSFHGPYALEDLEGAGADVAVLPTLCHESYGLVLDEAWMLGLPVVASDVEAFRERAGAGAWLVPPGDEEALAAALDRAVEDPPFLAGLRSAIRRIWTLPREAAERLAALYREVLDGGRRPLAPLEPVALEDRLRYEWTRSELRFASLLRRPGAPPPAEGTLPE